MIGSRLLARGWPPDHPQVVRAEGRRLWTADGRELLDGASGALAATLGYSDPTVSEAVARQVRELPFAHSLHFTTAVAERYAAELTDVLRDAGGTPLHRALLVTGGSEANEMALLAAYRVQALRGEPGRTLVLARHLSYHGSTLATLALGARRSLRDGVAPLLPAVAHLPPPYPYRPEWHARFPDAVAGAEGLRDVAAEAPDPEAVERARSHPAEAVAVAIETLGPDRVCAFVAEPIIGASAGAVVPPDDYWPRVAETCRRHGVLLILDEVMTGMGRTGRWLACQHWDLEPDVVTLGKGLGAGYVPLGAVAVRQEHWEALTEGPPGFPYGFTFAQHPVAAAAGTAVLRVLRERELLDRAGTLGGRLREHLRHVLRDDPHVGEIRGRGLLTGVELVRSRRDRAPFPPGWNATRRLLALAEEAGILLYPARGCADGVAGDAFLVAPAFTTTDAEAETLEERVVEAVRGLGRKWRQEGGSHPRDFG